MSVRCQECIIYGLFKNCEIWTSYYPFKSLISHVLLQRAKDTQEYIFFHLLSGSIPVRAQKLVLLLCFSLSLATGDAAEKC